MMICQGNEQGQNRPGWTLSPPMHHQELQNQSPILQLLSGTNLSNTARSSKVVVREPVKKLMLLQCLMIYVEILYALH